jgi:hypothetical protein
VDKFAEDEAMEQEEPAPPVRAGAKIVVVRVKPARMRARQESARTKPGEVQFDRGDDVLSDAAGFHYDITQIHRDQGTTITAADLILGSHTTSKRVIFTLRVLAEATLARLGPHMPDELVEALAPDLEAAKRDVGVNKTGEEYERAVHIHACPGPGDTKGCHLYWQDGKRTKDLQCPNCQLSRYVDSNNRPVGLDPAEAPDEETASDRKARKRKWKPRDVVRWWPLRYRLRRMWASRALARAMRYPIDRPAREGYILDVHDTPTWEKKTRVFGVPATSEEALYDHAFIISADATDFRKKSFTPVLARNTSLKPDIRDRPGQVCMTLLLSEVIKSCLYPIYIHAHLPHFSSNPASTPHPENETRCRAPPTLMGTEDLRSGHTWVQGHERRHRRQMSCAPVGGIMDA